MCEDWRIVRFLAWLCCHPCEPESEQGFARTSASRAWRAIGITSRTDVQAYTFLLDAFGANLRSLDDALSPLKAPALGFQLRRPWLEGAYLLTLE
jgi:hypothetical protein